MCPQPCAGRGAGAAPAFLAAEPVDAVDPRSLTFAAQQDVAPPVAGPTALVGLFPQPGAQRRVRWTARAVADHLAVRTDDGTGTPLREPHPGLQMRDRLALPQNADDPLFRLSRSLHRPSPCSGRTLAQNGGGNRAQVMSSSDSISCAGAKPAIRRPNLAAGNAARDGR